MIAAAVLVVVTDYVAVAVAAVVFATEYVAVAVVASAVVVTALLSLLLLFLLNIQHPR